MFFNRVKTFILIICLSSLCMILGNLFGGYQGMYIALAIALICNVIAYFYSETIVLRMYNAQPLDETQYRWIHDAIQDLAYKMNIPKPKLWIIHSYMANAFATGRNPSHSSVVITSGIIDILDKDELTGVLAHELSHIKNRDILIATIAATIATAISYMASMLRFVAFWGSSNRRRGNPFALILVAIVTPIVAMLIKLAISRSREFLADQTGATHTGNPLALASALKKLHISARQTAPHINSRGKESTASLFIVHPFSGKNMLSLFSTHPSMEKRIERLKQLYEKMFKI